MPWKELSVSEARARFVLAWREKGGSFASLCGRFGVSRKSAYKWPRALLCGGSQGFGRRVASASLLRKSASLFLARTFASRTQSAPRLGAEEAATGAAKNFSGREAPPGGEHSGALAYASQFGRPAQAACSARSGVAVEGLRVVRHCNEVWSVDFKGWFRTGDGRRCEPLTVRDVHSRLVLAVVLLPNQSEAAVRRALLSVFRHYGLPKAMRMDNGAPFGGKEPWACRV